MTAATHCPDCRKRYMDVQKPWCKKCDFPKVFGQWTSGDKKIDEFIKHTQNTEGIDYENNYLEWIPFDRFRNYEIIGRGGYGTVYSAEWIDGKRCWDQSTDPWTRTRQPCKVALKSLNSEMESHQAFIEEVRSHYNAHNDSFATTSFPMYGLSRDPNTQKYLIIMPFIENGNLRSYIHENFHVLNWEFKLQLLYSIAYQLSCIHSRQLVHRDLHGGNVLVKIEEGKGSAEITDFGLCRSADEEYVNLAKRCLDADPEKRPGTWEIRNFFSNRHATNSIPQEYRRADECKKKASPPQSNYVHSDAIYSSRLLDLKTMRQTFDTQQLNQMIEDFSDI
ncbi:2180_t:CDS:2 [Ambispora leptoticha]|uniref:2180_t:CDS:1 n=1 Tax=Ambispora leptoticha TaxID=144679 RepID=A0A9N8YZ96_9GLOM|nr:2180_t:CDS:2 [Ambispora leptoticha]